MHPCCWRAPCSRTWRNRTAALQRSLKWSQDNHCATSIAIGLYLLCNHLSSTGCLLRLIVLLLHVQAPCGCRHARSSDVSPPLPPLLLKVFFSPPCSITSSLPAAFSNILHRFIEPSSCEPRASVNETCTKLRHGIAKFRVVQVHKSVLMRSTRGRGQDCALRVSGER